MLSTDDRKKWEKHLERVEEQCKPRGSKLVAATQYKVLTQSDMELPEYIEEEAKGHGSQERYSPWSKESECLSKDQDSLTAERVIQIATIIYNSDCQRSIMQSLSTATAAVTAIQQGSTQLHSKRSFEEAENR